jgi:hypothetical protein
MERWIIGSDVMKRWGINFMELQSCILDDGLKPHDKDGKELHFRTRSDFTKTWTEFRHSVASEMFPDTYSPLRINKTFVYNATNMYFKLSDIEAFEKQHGIDRQDIRLRPSTEDRKEILRQAKGIWGDKPETHDTMASTLHKFAPGSHYSEEKIARWLKDEKFGRGRGRPKKA